MKFDYQEKLIGAPKLGAAIASAILGTVEAVTETAGAVAAKISDVAGALKAKAVQA